MSGLSDLLNATFGNLKMCSKALFDFIVEGINPRTTELQLSLWSKNIYLTRSAIFVA